MPWKVQCVFHLENRNQTCAYAKRVHNIKKSKKIVDAKRVHTIPEVEEKCL